MTHDALLRSLNPEQRAAVMTTEGPLLVLAGAGSGKTRVVTTRVAHLLRQGVPATAILAVTFTNKAADEMKERVAHLAGKAAQGVTMSTFHSLGLDILGSSNPRGKRAKRTFTILDQGDQIGIVKELLRHIEARKNFDAWALLERIGKFKNNFHKPGETPKAKDEYDEMAEVLYPAYEDCLRAMMAYDFDDLIIQPVRQLEENEEVRERWRTRFQYIHVDEYQDTSPAQLRLTAGLAAASRNLCVVGDDDQSIYGWRGADVRNILEFERQFPGATVVKLEENYRSTPIILEAANAVIAKNEARHPKCLRTSKSGGELIEIVTAPTPEDEAAFVTMEIKKLCDHGRKPGDIAILFRASNLTQPFEESLRIGEVPFKMSGGSQFYGRKEVKDTVAYLRVLLEPRDELALRRIVNYPARGVGPVTLDHATLAAKDKQSTLWHALETLPGETGGAKSAHVFLSQMAGFQKRVGKEPFIAVARELIHFVAIREDLASATAKGEVAEKRWGAVLDLLRAIENYENRTPNANIAQYLNLLMLRSSSDEEVESGDAVTLTTLHAAKGLEFPVVFIIGVEEEIMPHARTLNPRGPDGGTGDISEERRLCYVGITRAREKLYLTRSATRALRGSASPRTPSRFLADIPEALVRVRTLEELEEKRKERGLVNLRAAMKAVFD